MTALIICEDCNLNTVITVPAEAVGIEGSSIYLKNDEQITIRDLLYGLMLVSGNDSACALAIHHSGSVETFVDVMNQKAKKLGANNTHFVNPNGLPDDEHYTTAYDLCKITCEALKNELFSKVVSTKHYIGTYRTFTNKNKILNKLDGANGVKTGYTKTAGRCLVSSAKRNNMQVVCVVLNCYDMYEQSSKIIENCFSKYAVEEISKDKIFIKKGKLYSLKNDISFVVEKGKQLNYEVIDDENNNFSAKLNVYTEKSLIFSEKLFNIK